MIVFWQLLTRFSILISFKKQQEDAIQNFNDKLLDDAETVNYADDISLGNVKENKNLKISEKKK